MHSGYHALLQIQMSDFFHTQYQVETHAHLQRGAGGKIESAMWETEDCHIKRAEWDSLFMLKTTCFILSMNLSSTYTSIFKADKKGGKHNAVWCVPLKIVTPEWKLVCMFKAILLFSEPTLILKEAEHIQNTVQCNLLEDRYTGVKKWNLHSQHAVIQPPPSILRTVYGELSISKKKKSRNL